MNIELKRNERAEMSLVARVIDGKVSQFIICHDFDASKPDGEQWHGGTYFSDLLKASAQFEVMTTGSAVACKSYGEKEIMEQLEKSGYAKTTENVREVIWAIQEAVDTELNEPVWEDLVINTICEIADTLNKEVA